MSLSKDSCLDLKEQYLTDNIEEILELIANEKSLKLTEKQELREYYLAKQRTRDLIKEWELRANNKPTVKYFNYLQKSVLITEITEEMADREEQWWIDYWDYLHDLK